VRCRSFDAVLLIAFGGPQGPDDVRPFLENVLRGRRVAPGRLEEVAHHYELFGGVSPLREITERQARGLEAALARRGIVLPVHVGMRNWHPFLKDTLGVMSQAGLRRAIGVIAAPHGSYSSCAQYRENVADARRGLGPGADVEVTFAGGWHVHDGFISANAQNIQEALDRLPEGIRRDAVIAFTAHSIPVSMATSYPYEQQLRETADAIAAELARRTSAREHVARSHVARPHVSVVYQSRSGRPEDPWLGPDVLEYLRNARTRGVPGVVLSPIGFVADHVEVLYDLDVEAAGVARDIGLPLTRAAAVNDHPAFLDALADVVVATCNRYGHGRPLSLTGVNR
jgi:ferrochelatase